MKPRTRARSIALQALYEIDLVGHPIGTVLEGRLADASLEERLIEFTEKIVRGVWPMKDDLDAFIAEHAPEWPLDQVAIIDRNILRIATSTAPPIPLSASRLPLRSLIVLMGLLGPTMYSHE